MLVVGESSQTGSSAALPQQTDPKPDTGCTCAWRIKSQNRAASAGDKMPGCCPAGSGANEAFRSYGSGSGGRRRGRSRSRLRDQEQSREVILGGATDNSCYCTDTVVALLDNAIRVEVTLKTAKVGGIYD